MALSVLSLQLQNSGILNSHLRLCYFCFQKIEAGEKLVDEMKVNVEEISTKPEFTFEELETVENRPNLLAKKPHLGTILSVRQIKTPTDR